MSFDQAGLAQAMAAHGAVVRVVVAEVQGSAPREVGASMLVRAGGQDGTIGGGALEYDALRLAREMLGRGPARRFSRAILGPDMGQCCGGTVALLYELFGAMPDLGPDLGADLGPDLGAVFARPVEDGAAPDCPRAPRSDHPTLQDGWFIEPVGTPTLPVWIWGAGHVGRAIADVLAPLPGLAVTLVDTAPDRFPEPVPPRVTPRVAPELAQAVGEAPPDAHHFILTYSHDLDFALCDALLAHSFESAGLIGSATKWARFRSRLVEKGHPRVAIDRIRCPIGNPALGKAPESIALGVAHALLMGLAETEADCPGAETGGWDDRRASDA